MIQIQKGDVILFTAYHWWGHLIAFFQSLYNKDHAAHHDHAALGIGDNQIFHTTFTFTQKTTRKFSSQAVILRPLGMTENKFTAGWKLVADQEGRFYPYWRLFLHMIRLAKYIYWRSMGCSELVAAFLHGAGYWPDTHWGVDPDDLWDYARAHPDLFDIIYYQEAK